MKRFGPVTALDGATLVVRAGTIHALLGENGAGKTTLVRGAYGLVSPDAGRVLVDGRPLAARAPADAIAAGIGMVHQHDALVPAMTVAENFALGNRGRHDPRATAARIRALADRTGLAVDPSARAGDLPVAARQRVELLRAIGRKARTLILDEPTAVLAPGETRALLGWLRQFAGGGGSVVLITHKLREALEAADELTVLRQGRTALALPRAEATEAMLATAMLGTPSTSSLPVELADAVGAAGAAGEDRAPATGVTSDREAVVELRDASVIHEGVRRLDRASLRVGGGEVVGVVGVEGSGERELLRLLAGRLRPTSGSVRLPRALGFIPEDRQGEGLLLSFSLTENLALSGAGHRRGILNWPALAQHTAALIEREDVRAPRPGVPAGALSGGNQQKFLLARELDGSPPLVVAENPTRGLDVRATAHVHARLRDAARRGAAVVVYSSDLDEVLALATRILAVHDGRVKQVARDRDAAGRAMLGLSDS